MGWPATWSMPGPASARRAGNASAPTLHLGQERPGQKVAWARVSNCQVDEPGWAVKEILATQNRNTRSGPDRNYHLVVSFPDGERPSREQVEDIEDRLCKAMGFAELPPSPSASPARLRSCPLPGAPASAPRPSHPNPVPAWPHTRARSPRLRLEARHCRSVFSRDKLFATCRLNAALRDRCLVMPNFNETHRITR